MIKTTKFFREIEGVDQSDRHSLAMTQAVVLSALDRMTKGMAKIEDFAKFSLFEIFTHNVRFYADALSDQFFGIFASI